MLLAGFLAAALAFFANKLGQRVIGQAAAVYWAPPLEELAKTGLALLFRASLWGTHLVFGALEALVELSPPQASPAQGRGAKRRLAPAIASLTGHLLFGLVTLWGWQWFGHWAVGLLAAVITHFLWNAIVLDYFQPKED